MTWHWTWHQRFCRFSCSWAFYLLDNFYFKYTKIAWFQWQLKFSIFITKSILQEILSWQNLNIKNLGKDFYLTYNPTYSFERLLYQTQLNFIELDCVWISHGMPILYVVKVCPFSLRVSLQKGLVIYDNYPKQI